MRSWQRLKKELPEKYPFLQVITDKEKPAICRCQIRGDREQPGRVCAAALPGDPVPRDRKPFHKGSGRLELAEAIADPTNPLTARVIVNRVWQHHFGRGIVGTPSNFGQLGERPTHPELLDYLAARFVENGWSLEELHREIMLSDVYSSSAADDSGELGEGSRENRLLWRANRQRLDVEALRDSHAVRLRHAGSEARRERAEQFDEKNHKRTVYGFVSRRKLDGMLALFDFPNPNNTSEGAHDHQRPAAAAVLHEQRVRGEAGQGAGGSLHRRGRSADPAACIALLFGRDPEAEELQLGTGVHCVEAATGRSYARVLLSSNEFVFAD